MILLEAVTWSRTAKRAVAAQARRIREAQDRLDAHDQSSLHAVLDETDANLTMRPLRRIAHTVRTTLSAALCCALPKRYAARARPDPHNTGNAWGVTASPPRGTKEVCTVEGWKVQE